MTHKIISLLRPYFCQALVDCGMLAKPSYSLGEVCRLLDAMDYVFPEAMLCGWQERGLVPQGDDLSEDDILPIVAALELRKSWKASPSKHDHKKSRIRLSREQLPHRDVVQVLDSMSIYDSWFLLAQMLDADERSQREEIYEIMSARLNPLTCEFRPHQPSDSTENWRHVE